MTIGRPPIGPAIDIRIPAATISQLDAIAAEHGMTRAALIRQILHDWLQHHP